MTTLLRWIAGAPLALAATLTLFLLMAALIRQPSTALAAAPPTPRIVITAQKVDSPIADPAPPKPLPDTLPETIIEPAPRGGKPALPIELPGPDLGVDPDGTRGGPIGAPVIKVAPAYPERCRSRNAEGAVLVEFDIAADGAVMNARIIESADACFNRTVLSAVAKWRYRPDYRGGQPVARYGVVERFHFQLADN